MTPATPHNTKLFFLKMYDPFGKVQKIFLRKAEDTKNEIKKSYKSK